MNALKISFTIIAGTAIAVSMFWSIVAGVMQKQVSPKVPVIVGFLSLVGQLISVVIIGYWLSNK